MTLSIPPSRGLRSFSVVRRRPIRRSLDMDESSLRNSSLPAAYISAFEVIYRWSVLARVNASTVSDTCERGAKNAYSDRCPIYTSK